MCITHKEEQGASDVAADDEEMAEVSEGTQVVGSRSKWTLHQDLTPLALELLQNKVIYTYPHLCTYSTHVWKNSILARERQGTYMCTVYKYKI